MTSRELVHATLDYARPERIPRHIWSLPWAQSRYGIEYDRLLQDFPADITTAPEQLSRPTIARGDAYKRGTYVDEWGAIFTQAADGTIGEVKEPIVTEDSWEDTSRVHFPTERQTFDREAVRQYCASTETFVVSPNLARPFERLQFLRGTEDLFVDLINPPDGLRRFISRMHSFACELVEAWAHTDVDAITFMDDWGAQHALLVNPALWRSVFRPLYRDYIDIAHTHGKRAFMHSDGHILAIYPDLIDLGLDALNSQIFCMGIDELSKFAGRITFWGEIDRQHLLVDATEDEVRAAVRDVYSTLYRGGGCIAQCEFGAGARIENVRAVFDEWNRVH
jgi:uroporphyrinogen decarboxylase